ncbi:bifunctional nuclease domain-containing protein [Calditrichota bacterium]
MSNSDKNRMIPVEVTGVSVNPPFNGYVVILKEIDGEQWLPIFIGEVEAQTIMLLLQRMTYVRPLTYDLFNNLLEAGKSTVERVEVTKLEENTFYALVYLDTIDGVREVDARPSDAIALALKSNAPILVSRQVFEDSRKGRDLASDEPPKPLNRLDELNEKLKKAVDDEEYEEAAKLRDQINNLARKEGN